CGNARTGGGCELGEFAGLRVAVGARDRHLDVESSTAGRFYVRAEVERLECVMDEMGSLDDMAEGCAMGIEVEQDIVWSVREVTPRGPDVEIDTSIFDHPKQRGLVLDERVLDVGA